MGGLGGTYWDNYFSMEGPQLATNKITAGVLDAALLGIISAGAVYASGAACYAPQTRTSYSGTSSPPALFHPHAHPPTPY